MICDSCGREMRPAHTPPDGRTVAHSRRGLCSGCYNRDRTSRLDDEGRERQLALYRAANARRAEERVAAKAMLTWLDDEGEGWQKRALCAQPDAPDADLWFSTNPHDQARAKAICNGCPVWDRCAIAGKTERDGIWAGVDHTRDGVRLEAAS